MIIPLDKRSYSRNIINDSMESLTIKDIVFVQNTDNVDEGYLNNLINYFNDRLPLDESLLDEDSLKSSRINTKILGAYVFDNFSVNGKPFISDSNFLVFIRQALTGGKKVRFLFQKSRKIEDKNINNEKVLNNLSEVINNQGHVIDALHYIEEEKRLDFIVNCYGLEAKTSVVFIDDEFKCWELKNYPPSIIGQWTDLQFSFYCLHFLEKYNLNYKYCLLKDNYYCNKRFNVNAIIKRSVLENEEENYTREKIYFDNDYFHVLSCWDNNSREIFWLWLLNQINEVSDDIIIKKSSNISYLKLPTDYESFINDEDSKFEIRFRIQSYNDEYNVEEDEKSLVTITKSDDIFKKNFKNYFHNQELKINKEVFLIDSFLNKLISFDLFEILAIKEQSIVLIRLNCFVDKNNEQKLLEMIRGLEC